jgi:uncharacterized cupin superfamily protein
MDKLITIIPPDKVTDEYKKEAKTWGKWDSKSRKNFPFNYTAEEHVLVLEGSAELTLETDDGPAVVKIAKGDQVTFHKGLKCKWKITKRMKKHYTTVLPDDDEDAPPAIVCDVCDEACVEESYFMPEEEQDICPKCFLKDRDKYAGAEHQKEGEKWDEPEKEEKPKKKRKTKK